MESTIFNFLLYNLPGNMSQNKVFRDRILPFLSAKSQIMHIDMASGLFEKLQTRYGIDKLKGVNKLDVEGDMLVFSGFQRSQAIVGYCTQKDKKTIFEVSTINNTTLISTKDSIIEGPFGYSHLVTIKRHDDKGTLETSSYLSIYDSADILIDKKSSSNEVGLIKIAEEQSVRNAPIKDKYENGPLPPKVFPMTEAFIITDFEFVILPLLKNNVYFPNTAFNQKKIEAFINCLNNILPNPNANIILTFRTLYHLRSYFTNQYIDGFSEVLIENNGEFIKVGLSIKDDKIFALPMPITRQEAFALYNSDLENKNRSTLTNIFNDLLLK